MKEEEGAEQVLVEKLHGYSQLGEIECENQVMISQKMQRYLQRYWVWLKYLHQIYEPDVNIIYPVKQTKAKEYQLL